MHRLLAAATALSVLATPFGGTARAGGGLAEIQALLDRRSGALVSGDRAAFLGTIATSATAAFRQRQGHLFDGYRALGVESYAVEVDEHEELPGLATDRERRRYGEGVAVLHLTERSRIAGFDPEPLVEDLFFTFVPEREGWRIAGDADLDDLTLWSGRKLWEAGPIETRERGRFRVVAHPDLVGEADAVLAAAERAARRVDERWPLPWPGRVLILMPSTTAELERLIQATFDLDAFVAFAASGVDREDDWVLSGHRVLIHWQSFSRHPAASRERILAHELLHIATREIAGPQIPVFVEEGIAEWVAGGSTSVLASRVSSGSFDRRLPDDHEFLTGGSSDILNAYQESFTALAYAVDRWGPGSVAAFYRSLGEVRLAPGTWRYHVSRAMRDAFGVGLGAFERGWADDLSGGA